MGIRIQTPGILTTVQDLGRLGYQAFGVSPAGAADALSFTVANLLVGNDGNEGALEITLGGASIVFEQDNLVSVCGAPAPILLDGVAQEANCAFLVRAGQTLSLLYAQRGMQIYVAFAGGLDVPAVMGSRATHIKSAVGGLDGRKLRSGDRIGFCRAQTNLGGRGRRYAAERQFPKAGETVEIRLIPGPQEARFIHDGVSVLYGSDYEISPVSDRMGYRLNGQPVPSNRGEDILTDGIVFGSVQIPPSGLPIIMMADRQTTGGYAKIATVASVDLPLLSQCPPGTRIRFARTSVEAAQALCRSRKEHLAAFKADLAAEQAQAYAVCFEGKKYFVEIRPGQ